MVYKSAQEGTYNPLEVVIQYWIDGDWINYTKDTYTNNDQGQMTERLHQRWTVGNWIDDENDTYTYDDQGNMTEKLRQIWIDNEWIDSSKYTYTYTNYFFYVHSSLS